MIVVACEEILPFHQEKIENETREQTLLYRSVQDIPKHVAASLEVLLAYGPSFAGEKIATFERFPNLKWV